MNNNKVQYGVSLYSFSTEYIHEKMDLEDILKKVKELGFTGIEIVAAQMVPEYPYPSDAYLEQLKDMINQYDLTPVCWSAYVDMGIRTDRDLTESEIIQFTVNDLIYAKKAGFPMVRTQHAISPEIFRKMIPWCKRLDMQLTIEMHHPHHFNVPVWQTYFEIIRNEGKGYLGFVPDFSIFQRTPHQLYLNQAIAFGFREDRLREAVALHEQGIHADEIIKGDFTNAEKAMIYEFTEKFCPAASLEGLRAVMDCAFYIHGKFYYLDSDETDPCIPYEEILRAIRESGYCGYIASEYEGHHFDETVDSALQLQRYVRMNRRIWAGLQK